MRIRVVEISGFGGRYEDGCQKMIRQGIRFLEEHPTLAPEHKEYEGVYGLAIPQNDDAKALRDAIVKDIPGGVTGAMYQFCLKHIYYIARNGYDGWIREGEGKHVIEVEVLDEEAQALMGVKGWWKQ